VLGRASGIKIVGMAEVGAPISQDRVAVHRDCWCDGKAVVASSMELKAKDISGWEVRRDRTA